MPAPDFVVIGHAAVDVVPGGWRLGGTVTFAAAQAHRLGMRVGVLTSAAPDVDVQAQIPYADVVQLPAAQSTTFENIYVNGERRQRSEKRAAPIMRGDVPETWRDAPLVLIGPVLDEVEPSMAAAFTRESGVGVSPQGWLRSVDVEGNVVRRRYDGTPFWRGADAVFVSDEDLAGGREDTSAWTAEVPVIVMTESYRGAQVWSGGRWRRIGAFPANEVDPTGAGDTFATAFLIRFREAGDLDEAVRFGAAAASLSVGGPGVEATASREEIEAQMRRYPDVALR
jgi:sugar/nucleoside kinase (ribokinase family)